MKTGHYILYAYNSSLNQVNLSKIYVTSSTTISPNYISAYGLNFSNSLGLNSATYSITSGIGTINASKAGELAGIVNRIHSVQSCWRFNGITSSTTISPNYISAYGLNLSNSLGLNSGTYSITSGIGTINV